MIEVKFSCPQCGGSTFRSGRFSGEITRQCQGNRGADLCGFTFPESDDYLYFRFAASDQKSFKDLCRLTREACTIEFKTFEYLNMDMERVNSKALERLVLESRDLSIDEEIKSNQETGQLNCEVGSLASGSKEGTPFSWDRLKGIGSDLSDAYDETFED